MGLGIVRLGIDLCTGHPAGPTYFQPRPPMSASTDVFVDGIPAVRMGDLWNPHTNIISVHTGVGVGGSSTVFCNGLPIMRVTDPIDCGSVAMLGSTTTFAG